MASFVGKPILSIKIRLTGFCKNHRDLHGKLHPVRFGFRGWLC